VKVAVGAGMHRRQRECVRADEEYTTPLLGMYPDIPSRALGFEQELTIKRGGDMRKEFLRLWCGEEGQDLTEYGLLLLLIAMLSIAVVQGLGSAIENVFSNASSSLS